MLIPQLAPADLPYGFEAFLENVADYSHFPVAHHNVLGNRYKDPSSFKWKVIEPMSAQNGFIYEVLKTHN